VALESIKKKRARAITLDVKARGFDYLGVYLSPPKSKGNKILMVKGNMWFYRTGLSKPIPISRRQKLMGQAAYGDIASTNYARDYQATLLAEEEINGELCDVFDLKSINKKTTYDRIKYWISKERLVGVKAEYFTVSGKIFKSAAMEYANTVTIDAVARPFISKISIKEALGSNDVTFLKLSKPSLKKLSDSTFNLNLLRR
jgi:hypothetical protein